MRVETTDTQLKNEERITVLEAQRKALANKLGALQASLSTAVTAAVQESISGPVGDLNALHGDALVALLSRFMENMTEHNDKVIGAFGKLI